MDFNIAIGQYIKGDSWIYRLDPRFKILSIIILMVVLFMLPTIYHILGALGLLILILVSARLPILHILKSLKPIIFISMFSFILQVIYTQEGTLMYTINFNISILNIGLSVLLFLIYLLTKRFIPFSLSYFLLTISSIFLIFVFVDYSTQLTNLSLNIYTNGLLNGSFFVIRILCILLLSILLTLTTSTMDLNTGLEKVLMPFKFILPVSQISLMISLTLRFVPTLLLETNKILKAQASRGVDFSEGSLIQKVKQIITLLIPMFVVSFKRAEDLADAMESRGYIIGEKRTNLNVLKYHAIDYVGFLFLFSSLAYVILLQVGIW